MKWLADLFSSSVGKKLVMALTGMFMIVFLIIHLAGNLQLLNSDGGRAFNLYAEFMGTNPFIQAISKVNFIIIFIHIFYALLITHKNKIARGSPRYSKVSTATTSWPSRNMGILGFVLFFFVIIHLRHFWFVTHFGGIATIAYEGKQVPDLHAVVKFWFSKNWYVCFYAFCMLGFGSHLWHGFSSAFQSLGISHYKYNGMIINFGKSFAIIVPGLFALIPIISYFKQE